MCPEETSGRATEDPARQASRKRIALGAGIVLLVGFAALAPILSDRAVTILIGALLIAAGAVEFAFAGTAETWGLRLVGFLFGGLCVVAGLVIVTMSVETEGVLPVLLAALFLFGGAADLAFALQQRSRDGFGWMLGSGLASITIGVLIVSQRIVTGVWAVGLYTGFRIMLHGWVLMALENGDQGRPGLPTDSRGEGPGRPECPGDRSCREAEAETDAPRCGWSSALSGQGNLVYRDGSSPS